MKGKKTKKKWIIIIPVILVILLLVTAYVLRPKGQAYTEEVTRTQDITTYYSFSGNIEAKEKQDVVSKSTLPIKKLYVKKGDRVTAGDLLFELDNSSLASSLEQARAGANIARINYEKMQTTTKDQQLLQASGTLSAARMSLDNAGAALDKAKSLFNEGSLSQTELDKTQNAYDSARSSFETAQKSYDLTEASASQNIRTAKEQLNQAQASLSLLEKQMEDTKILAEVSGEVDEIYAEENSSLVMGTKIMSVVNYDDLEVTVKVDEYDLAAVTAGKKAKVTVSAIDKEVEGTVTELSRQAVVANDVSYFPATITLAGDKDLRVGMSAEVKVLNHDEKNVTTVSMKALQFDNENRPYVYIRDLEGKAIKKYITVGVNDGVIVQVTDGVKSGETVLIPKAGAAAPFDMMNFRRENK